MLDNIGYYKEYSELTSFSEERERDNRCKRIGVFVKEFNAQQEEAGLYLNSVQCKMHRIKEDVERLRVMKALLNEIFEGQKALQMLTKSFINTERLNNADVNRLFITMKREHYIKLDAMESFGETRTSALVSIQEQIDDFLIAYAAKEKTLILLRKNASNDLVCMFDIFLCLKEMPLKPLILSKIMRLYMKIIFSSVVMINAHMILSAFTRIRCARK